METMLSHFGDIKLAHAWVLWLIPAVFVLFVLWWIFFRKRAYATLKISSSQSLEGFGKPWRAMLKKLLPVLRLLALIFLLLALARPQITFDEEKITNEGIDLVLAVDVSTSMLAKDFSPNRLEAAKKEAVNFIEGRPHDRIGLVIFAGESNSQCPITIDHAIVKTQLKGVKNGLMEDGTAIGMGLGTSVQRLKDAEAKSKVVILMTDGVNNKGSIDPLTACDLAVAENIRVYTIGIGTNGQAMTPVAMRPDGEIIFGYAEVEIDEALLKDIAKKTGGQYFRATNNKKLKDIYEQIDKLEKTKIEVSAFERKTEKFHVFALCAMLMVLVEILMRYWFLRSMP